MIPGEWLLSDEPVELNAGRRKLRMAVRNTGDRAIQVGSHFHFFETNRALDFDRASALGMRLDVPSGQSIRFEAGDEREVALVEIGGMRRIVGFNGLLDGAATARWISAAAIDRAVTLGFSGAAPNIAARKQARDRPAAAHDGAPTPMRAPRHR